LDLYDKKIISCEIVFYYASGLPVGCCLELGVMYLDRSMLDVASGVVLMDKILKDARNLSLA